MRLYTYTYYVLAKLLIYDIHTTMECISGLRCWHIVFYIAEIITSASSYV